MKLKLFIYLIAVVSLFFSACAGRQVVEQTGDKTNSHFQPRTRFIPEEKKLLFIGSIFNQTQQPEIEIKLREKLAAQFSLARDLIYTQDYSTAEIYVGLDIIEATEQDFLYNAQLETKKKRWFLKFRLTLKDLRTGTKWVDGVEIGISTIEIKDQTDVTAGTLKAFDALYEKIYLNIDSYIHFGTPFIDTRYGYEDIPEVNGVLFKTSSSSSTAAEDFQEGDENLNLTEEQKRELEIRRRDENGGQSGVR